MMMRSSWRPPPLLLMRSAALPPPPPAAAAALLVGSGFIGESAVCLGALFSSLLRLISLRASGEAVRGITVT
jgi:hypothetical protein